MGAFANLKLKYKVIIMAVLPVLIMCIVAIGINNTVVKDKLISDTKESLHATAESVLAAYDQNSGEYFLNSAGDLWKGAYNVSLSETFLDNIAESTGIDLTFFYGDRRLVTTLKDDEGNRITGSKAGEFLVENVLTEGSDVFSNRIQVEDEMYYGYYIPVCQADSTEIIGMIFAGRPVSEISESLNFITNVFMVTIVVILLITILACWVIASGIAKSIHESMYVVQQLSEGKLSVNVSEKSLRRKDEVGELSQTTKSLLESLNSVIGSISDNSKTLNASSDEMTTMAGQANEAMDTINENLKSILDGATEQSNNARNVSKNIDSMNRMLTTASDESDVLADSAKLMLDSTVSVENSLGQLQETNETVLKAISKIQTQTKLTGESVEKIQTAVTLISDIAEETNLLSLNASIEAARAGEAGKGFAVVAQEISKLADQSNAASAEIEEIVIGLNENSNQTINIMDDVQNAINEQSESMAQTSEVFATVKDNIRQVADGVENIRAATVRIGRATDSIAKDMASLDEISVRNEDTVEGTLQRANDVLDVVTSVSSMSAEVSSSANVMADAVSEFDI